MTATIKDDNRIIVGDVYEDGNISEAFAIFAYECDTEQKVLAWVRQLCDKQGVDINTIRSFIECCGDLNPRLDIYNTGVL